MSKTRIIINSITFDSLVQNLGNHKLANKFPMIPRVQQRPPWYGKVKLWSQKKKKKLILIYKMWFVYAKTKNKIKILLVGKILPLTCTCSTNLYWTTTSHNP